MSVYQKLSNIQKNLFVPKGQRNNFGKYNYRSCEDILKAVKPICEEQGCILFMSNNLVNIGNRNYVEAVVRLIDLESGEEITSTAHAREEETKKGMDGSQITGASSSYARKYALAGLFSIDNEKDSDSTNTGENSTDYEPYVYVSKAQQEGKSGQLICPVCGEVVNGMPTKDGRMAPPEEVIQRLGMCFPCYQKRGAEKQS